MYRLRLISDSGKDLYLDVTHPEAMPAMVREHLKGQYCDWCVETNDATGVWRCGCGSVPIKLYNELTDVTQEVCRDER